MFKYKIGVIGAGNMATAIINGILKSKILNAREIIITDIDENKLKNFSSKGIDTDTKNESAMKNSEFLLFALKPQVFNSISDTFNNISSEKIISIMAGITINKLVSTTNVKSICRIMPNTPCFENEGMSALSFVNYKQEDKDFIFNIFKNLGKIIELEENKFDAVTSVSGSGPAYVFEFAKAMIDGGMDGNLTYEDSKTLTLQTIKGAVKMMENFNDSIDSLTDAVCSKGGTTIQAINYFKEQALNKTIRQGIKLCKKRSEELSKD